jgi:superfamily I DNA and/or RNA helicase
MRKYPNEAKNIGVIAPYQAQKSALIKAFKELERTKFKGTKILNNLVEISTIDGFQVISS